MKIRPASSADLAEVLAIEASRPTAPGWKAPHFESELKKEHSLFIVAEGEAGVLGYACAWKVASELQIHSVVVAKEASQQGLGKALLRHLLTAARGAGLETVLLEVSAQNEAALALYRGAGFKMVGRRAKFYNDGSDAILMDLRLK